MIRIRKKAPTFKKIELPKIVLIGNGVLPKIPRIIDIAKNPLIVTGKKTEKVAGKKVQKIVAGDKINIKTASIEEVERVINEIEQGYDLIIGVGGGSILDVTKLAAHRTKTISFAVPTNCSNDGMASPFASIKTNGKKETIKAKTPLAIIADTKIIRKSPKKFTSAGYGDAIAKYTAVQDWNLGKIIKKEYYGDYASSLSIMIANLVGKNARDIGKRNEHGVNVLIEALISSGAAMGIAGSSRPASGSEHKFSHALDLIAKKPALHGFQCGVGTIIMSYLHGKDWKSIKQSLEIAGCPTTAKGLKMDSDLMLNALMKAKEIKPERYTIIDHINFDMKIARNALETTGVI